MASDSNFQTFPTAIKFVPKCSKSLFVLSTLRLDFKNEDSVISFWAFFQIQQQNSNPDG